MGMCVCAGPAGAQYFDLLQEQAGSPAVAGHLVAHDLLSSIVHHISQHVATMVQAEYGCCFGMQHVTGPGCDRALAR